MIAKGLLFIFIAVLIYVSTRFYFVDKKGSNPAPSPTRTFSDVRREITDAYFISNMRNRKYENASIKIEENLGSFGKFSSNVISFLSDGLKIYALMSIPTSKKPEKGFPVVIVNHGYINPSDYSTKNSYRSISDFYAANGFLVLKPDFRGHGKSEKGEGGNLNRINYAIDVLHLIAAVPSIPEANAEKIFLYGHSMGGEVVLRVLETSEKIIGATFWAPAVTDFPESILYFIRKHRAGEVPEIEKELNTVFTKEDYDKVSTLSNIKYIKTPLIIHHGKSDESVPYSWSVELDRLLKEKNISHTFYPYDGEDHNFTKGSWGLVGSRDLEFFGKYLPTSASTSSATPTRGPSGKS